MPHFQLFHKRLESKFLLQFSRGMAKGNLPHPTVPGASSGVVTALPISVESRKPKGFQWLCTDPQAASPLFVPILPLPSCLKPREVFYHNKDTPRSYTPAKGKSWRAGSKGWMFPFLLELLEQNVLLSWKFVVSFQFIWKQNLKFQNILELQVFISHLFLYNERNTWVDKKDQPQPREQRSLSSVIPSEKFFLEIGATKSEITGEQRKWREQWSRFLSVLAKQIFLISLLVIFSWKRLLQKSFWLALVAVMKNITALYKSSCHFVMFLFQLLN